MSAWIDLACDPADGNRTQASAAGIAGRPSVILVSACSLSASGGAMAIVRKDDAALALLHDGTSMRAKDGDIALLTGCFPGALRCSHVAARRREKRDNGKCRVAYKARVGEVMEMKLYFLSLGAGFLAGLLYGALNVRSPAPPVIALVGLLGILLGEQAMPLLKHAFSDDATHQLGIRARIGQHLFGHLPGHDVNSTARVRAVDVVASNDMKKSGIDHAN